ncbi:MAG: hypothetical protein ACRDZ4_18735, partial [Egibacteraceae bacterium]
MTTESLLGSAEMGTSAAAATEAAWEQLRPQLGLRKGFWLGFVFCADLDILRELEQRAVNFLRIQAMGVSSRHIDNPDDLERALGWLLGSHPAGIGLVWLAGVADGREWLPAWDRFLRRLNEQRDALRQGLPAGLVLVGPPGLLPVARDAAPDLWSYRSMIVDLPTVRVPAAVSARAPEHPRAVLQDQRSFAELALQAAVEGSPPVRVLLREAAAELQAGSGHRAAPLALRALETATSADDELVAKAWLARALEARGDLAAALGHADQTLAAGRPLGVALTRALLGIMASSPDPDRVQEARERELALWRLMVERFGETPESLRDLSVSLDNVATVNRLRGQLDAALDAYTESLALARRIRDHYGETPESLRDLSVSL